MACIDPPGGLPQADPATLSVTCAGRKLPSDAVITLRFQLLESSGNSAK